MHLPTSSQMMKNEQQSRAENGKIAPLFLRVSLYSPLDEFLSSSTLLADVLMLLLSVTVVY